MSIPLPPSSPSARQLRQPSPTSPSYSEHQYKRTLLDDVKNWSEQRVTDWLCNQALGRFSQKFIEHNISGSVLLDLDYEAFKAMDIKTVGERVRLVAAIKALRQECYLAASLAARTPTRTHTPLERHTNGSNMEPKQHEGLHVNESFASTPTTASSKISKSTETSAKSLLNRSNSFSRFLGRSDSKRSQRAHNNSNANVSSLQSSQQSQQQQNSDVYSQAPSSPRTLQKVSPPDYSPSAGAHCFHQRNSLEGGIMSMEKVKQTCVKVFGEDGQTRIVNVHTANEAKQIMGKVLHKFGIDESNADSYCIFVGSSTNGEARALSDLELIEICRSADRPEKERLILRKRHMYPTHEEFKRKGTINANRRGFRKDDDQQQKPHSPLHNNWNSSSSTLNRPDYYANRASQVGSLRSNTTSSHSSSTRGQGRRRFFGERPPSEIISSNLQSFFPNHNREVLETAGIKAQRLSMTRRNSALSRMEPRNYRNSVLPELVSVLGVDLDKFLEEEEDQEDVLGSDISSDTSSDSGSCISSDHEESIAETKSIKNDTHLQPSDEGDVQPGASIDKDAVKDLLDQQKKANQRRTSSLNYLNELKSFKLDENKTEALIEKETASETSIPAVKEPVTTPTSATKSKLLPDTWMKGSLIGRGTFGDVYLGLNPISGELMAVKQVELPVENSATEERKKSMVQALHREIELLRELEHDNIVQYLGSKEDESYFSIFLEYVPGGSVAGLLSSYGAFQEPLVKSFVRQILKGLNYLHNKDIVHRDIKGANVLVDNKGGVKITDFGISKKVEEDIILQGQSASAAHRPSLQGSIYWMAPEVVKQTHYTRKADIWSLGCMVVEMLTGDHPFPEYSQMQAIFQIGCYTAPNIPANLSEDAQDFLRCTFQLNHEERPSADELLKHPFLHESPEDGDNDASSIST
ncbi:MAP kinase [Mucor lusitanicus]